MAKKKPLTPVERIEEIAAGDLDTHSRTLRRIRHWQKRIWRESQKESK